MSLFAIADTHLSFSTDKPMNIFQGWDDYVERLKKNWTYLITEDDTVVLPGDISWAMSLSEALEDFIFLDDLPGKKIIMKGNHDYWWTTRRKMDNFLYENYLDTITIVHNDAVRVGDVSVCGTRGWFYDAEDDDDKRIVMREVGRLNASIDRGIELGGEPVVFLHYPPIHDGMICDEIYETLVKRGIKRCYYGHLHGYAIRKAFTGQRDGITFKLVSADALGFVPMLVER